MIEARRPGWPFEQGIPALVGFGCGHLDGRRATIAPTLSTAIVAASLQPWLLTVATIQSLSAMISLGPHQFRTRKDAAKPQRTRSIPHENAVESTKATFILPLITVWLQVRVLPGPPRFALTGYAWRSHAEIGGAKRVRRSLSVAKAKTDRRDPKTELR